MQKKTHKNVVELIVSTFYEALVCNSLRTIFLMPYNVPIVLYIDRFKHLEYSGCVKTIIKLIMVLSVMHNEHTYNLV